MNKYVALIESAEQETKEVAKRAGIIPYMVDENGDVQVYTMIPSHPDFGGTMPQMAKGQIDDGMDSLTTAMKEGEEEIGLHASNVKNVKLLKTIGYLNGDKIDVYYGEVIDKDKWGEPHWETGWAGWVNISKEMNKIRKVQRPVFAYLMKKIQ